ncbi:unnamed protein product [Ectocarpus sp. 4 AP-2014]
MARTPGWRRKENNSSGAFLLSDPGWCVQHIPKGVDRRPEQVLMSEWGHILSQLGVLPKGHQFDLANATLGVFYFAAVFLHRLFPLPSYQAKAKVVFAMTVPVVGVSLYLMFILLVVLKDICLICVSIYGVNLAVLVLSYRGLRGNAPGPRTSFDRKSD